MRIYLSGPMRGIPDDNFPAFREFTTKLRDKGHQVYCPPEADIILAAALGKKPTIRELFSQDTQWICNEAEGIAMMPGWKNSKGATAEHALASALDLEIIYL